jgi:hypothetical protein
MPPLSSVCSQVLYLVAPRSSVGHREQHHVARSAHAPPEMPCVVRVLRAHGRWLWTGLGHLWAAPWTIAAGRGTVQLGRTAVSASGTVPKEISFFYFILNSIHIQNLEIHISLLRAPKILKSVPWDS